MNLPLPPALRRGFRHRFFAGLPLLGWFAASLFLLTNAAWASEPLLLHSRQRVPLSSDTNTFRVVETTRRWEPRRTAIVICDMWDQHWCRGATERVAEMAPRMNDVVRAARDQGVLIIHCPSGTLDAYKDTPMRRLAQSAPMASLKAPVQGWCGLDRTREAALPIDDSDGGCDDEPQCRQGSPWRRQIATIEVREGDAITDSVEALNLMAQRGIENVIVMGVHLNMCVLGRPFGIRQLVRQGKQVVLMRDLTDTMYNSKRRPGVDHFTGTDLMVEHVEKYWCGTVTSDDVAGGRPFRFAEDRRPHVVVLVGEDEYRTWETLPRYVQEELLPRHYRASIFQEDPNAPGSFGGLVRAVPEADVLLVSIRRRALPQSQMAAIRQHLEAGKPLVGIRTTSHAFALRAKSAAVAAGGEPRLEWPDFDPTVLGGNYQGHHGPSAETRIRVAPDAENHPVLAGFEVAGFFGHGSLYRVSPLKAGTVPLLLGSIPNQPEEPLAWTHAYGPKQARVFYTSLGHWEDFADAKFRQLLTQGIRWALAR